jgi:hypothetical protein
MAQSGRDDDQREMIQAILGELPNDHPAREAYQAGAGPIQLMSLV